MESLLAETRGQDGSDHRGQPFCGTQTSSCSPPGTSKWNKIEHRLFCHITRTWQGRPLEDLTTVVHLIGSTKAQTGLSVHAWLDEKDYPKGKKISDAELASVNLKPHRFHGEWNYEIRPREN